MLELIDRLRRFHGEILHGVDVAEPVGTLDGVIEVPLPAVGRHVVQRGGDTALCCNRVRTGRENLGDASRLEALFGHAESRAQAGATGTDDHDVVGVVNIGVGLAGLGEVMNGCHVDLPYECDLQDGEKTEATDQDCKERVQHQKQKLGDIGMDIVLDDHLHAELHMDQCRQHDQSHDDGNKRVRQCANHFGIGLAVVHDQKADEEEDQR